MADKRIQDLTPASSVQTSDRFVLEQSGQAKSLTGQILINDLAAFLDGHGGIADISYTPPSSGSLTGTLTVTLADETVETFSVTNGRGIASFAKTGTSGLEDTYTITYNDGSTPTEFTVTNGRSIESIGYVESVGLDDYYQIDYNDGDPTTFIVHNGEKGDTGDNWFVHIKWAAVMPTQDSDMVNIPSDFIGIYAGTSATAPTDYTEYAWYDYKGEKGDTGTSISSVAWQSSSGLVDTYRVNFDDGTSTTFNVTNGSNISSITKTSTVGLVDTYVVTLTNGNQTSFQVNNGKSIVSIAWSSTTSPTGVPHVPGATDTYTVSYNDGDSTTFQVYNGLDGEGASITVDGIPSTNGNVPLLTIDTEHGAPTPLTQGSPKSRYFDAINSVLYICLGYDENNGYIWRGAGVTVDSALSSSSTNPVQNRVITNKIGTAALDTTAQDLSGAVNEILDDISGFADNLADEYDPTATYAVGDLCLHNNTLYRCNTDISTPEAWNSIHWTQTSLAEDKVSKSGDTMSGGLTIQDITGASNSAFSAQESDYGLSDLPSSGIQRPVATFLDKDGTALGLVRGYLNQNGRSGLEVSGRNVVGGSSAYNTISLYVNADGTKSVSVSDAAAWRDAISAVNKAGDTMTGVLNLGSSSAVNKNSDIPTTAPSATQYSDIFTVKDSGGTAFGYLSSEYTSGGRKGLLFQVARGGVYNVLRIAIDDNGDRQVLVNAPDAWRSALGLGTSGALPITIAQGGTGQTEVTGTTTISQIVTAASGFSIENARYTQWGKVAMVTIAFKKTTAQTTVTTMIAGTLVSGKRPAYYAPAVALNSSISWSDVYSNGNIRLNGTWAANGIVYVHSIYLLP